MKRRNVSEDASRPDRLIGLHGQRLLMRVWHWLTDEEVGAVERCSTSLHRVSCQEVDFWSRQRLQAQLSALLPNELRQDAESDAIRRNWEFARANWHTFGPPAQTAWRDQYRAFALLFLGVRVEFALINCDTHTFHCWVPLQVGSCSEYRVPSFRRCAKRATWHKAKLDQRGGAVATRRPWLAAPARRHANAPSRVSAREVLLHENIHERLTQAWNLIQAGTAFCLHATTVFAGAYEVAAQAAQDQHRRSLPRASSDRKDAPWLSTADFPRCTHNGSESTRFAQPLHSRLCCTRVSAAYILELYQDAPQTPPFYDKMNYAPAPFPEHWQARDLSERKTFLNACTLSATVMVEHRRADTTISLPRMLFAHQFNYTDALKSAQETFALGDATRSSIECWLWQNFQKAATEMCRMGGVELEAQPLHYVYTMSRSANPLFYANALFAHDGASKHGNECEACWRTRSAQGARDTVKIGDNSDNSQLVFSWARAGAIASDVLKSASECGTCGARIPVCQSPFSSRLVQLNTCSECGVADEAETYTRSVVHAARTRRAACRRCDAATDAAAACYAAWGAPHSKSRASVTTLPGTLRGTCLRATFYNTSHLKWINGEATTIVVDEPHSTFNGILVSKAVPRCYLGSAAIKTCASDP